MDESKRKAIIEAAKEGGRWVVFLAISWLITETLAQINLVPATADIKVWVFTYSIPVRLMLQFTLTIAGRVADKYVHEWDGTKLKGLLPF